MEESSGDEGNMLESFVLSSNILKKGANASGSAANNNPDSYRPAAGGGNVYAKNKQSQMHRMSGK